MNYGNTFVASTAALHSRTQALKALVEAAAYDGPSVVLAYTPVMKAGGGGEVVDEVNTAVTQGTWPMYRWNPDAENAASAFQLDSAKLRTDIEAFVKRDSDLSLMTSAVIGHSAETKASLEHRLQDKHRELASGGGGGGADVPKIDLSIVVAFGSDGGNAMSLAEKFARRAEVRHVREVCFSICRRCLQRALTRVVCAQVRCVEANSLSVESLSGVDAAFFILATAGQGEFCGNSKSFWKEFSGAAAKKSAAARPPKFSVLGLGDSAYVVALNVVVLILELNTRRHMEIGTGVKGRLTQKSISASQRLI